MGFESLVMLLVFILGILIILSSQPRASFSTVGMKMKRAIPAPWSLAEFLRLKPNRWKVNQYYMFSEETVRSLGYRYIGRFDSAVLHWEETAVLDLLIEHKFPLNHLPDKAKAEDIFQAGLYALALMESGISCSSARLVTIYCLQDKAKRCLDGNNVRECWKCGDGKVHVQHFKPDRIRKSLKKMDEVWYNGRKPQPASKLEICRVCPYSRGKCNYSAV